MADARFCLGLRTRILLDVDKQMEIGRPAGGALLVTPADPEAALNLPVSGRCKQRLAAPIKSATISLSLANLAARNRSQAITVRLSAGPNF